MKGMEDSRLPQPVPLLIVDAVRIYRDALKEQLSSTGLIDVVMTLAALPGDFSVIADANAKIVLVNYVENNPPQVARELRRTAPDISVIVLAVPMSEQAALACIEAGAAGYVTAEQTFPDLVEVITSVARGEAACSPRMVATLLRRLAALAADHGVETPSERLTARERQVALHVAQGMSNEEIATELFIELSTVKNHVHNILKKLQVRRRGEVATALRNRLRSS